MSNIKTKISTYGFRFLRFFCPPQLLEEIEGDLMQRYEKDLEEYNAKKAKRKLLWNTIRFFRPGILLRNNFTSKLNPNFMLHNYFKVCIRNIFRYTSFSLINISGLAIGISCTVLVLLWIQNELSFDRTYPDNKQLFKAWNRATIDGEIQTWNTTPYVLASTLKEEYPEVEYATSYADWHMEFLFSNGDTRFTSNKGPVTSTSFLKIFNFPFRSGDLSTALNDPFSIVLTEKFSNRLFGNREAIGESIHVKFDGNELDFQVTGVLKDLPNNTSFDFDYLISWELFKAMGEEDDYWGNNSVANYVKLKANTLVDEFNSKIKNIESRHTNGEHTNEIFLYPVSQQYLYSKFANGKPDGGHIEVVRLFGVVAGFILLISCINFINLSTARSDYRSKEIGIRKTIGAKKSNLLVQFLSESLLIACIAGLVAIVVVHLSLSFFNDLTGKELVIDYFSFQYWGGIFATIVICGFLAGSYPALLLSSFRPQSTLKGTFTPSSRATFRQALVVFQFGFAMILIVATLVVRDQISFAAQRDSGYNQNNLIYFPLNGDLSQKFSSFSDELLKSGTVTSISKTYSPLTQIWSSTDGLEWQGKAPNTRIDFDRFSAYMNLVETAGLQLLAGRDLDLETFPSDSNAVLINESATHVMHFDNPIGQTIKDGSNSFTVIGVFKDIIVRSPYHSTKPMIVMGLQNWFYTVHVKLNSEMALKDAIVQSEAIFKKYCPEYPFEYHFIDEEYQKKFNEEKRTRNFATTFGLLSIIISCLGVLGLSMYMIQKRIREIGIRKVFGASTLQVIALLTKEPIKLILIAFVIAVPIGYYLIGLWLQKYEYRVDIGWQVFVLTGVGSLIIAWITVGIQSINSAIKNPVDSLKYE